LRNLKPSGKEKIVFKPSDNNTDNNYKASKKKITVN